MKKLTSQLDDLGHQTDIVLSQIEHLELLLEPLGLSGHRLEPAQRPERPRT